MKYEKASAVCGRRVCVAGGLFFLFLLFFHSADCLAVTSKVVRQSSGEQLVKGEAEDVIVSSDGTIQLGRAAEVLVGKFEQHGSDPNAGGVDTQPWSINCISVGADAIYVGTSPDGGIYKYSLGELTKIYSAEPDKEDETSSQQQENRAEQEGLEPNDVNEAAVDVNEPGREIETVRHLANEHIFAMARDVSGRLLAGISGDSCRLCRLESGQLKTIFEPNDAKYIFAIAVGDDGGIFVGTGPEGKIYRLDSFGRNPELIFDSSDRNILSLVIGADGFVYAGSDTRGLVYKIEPAGKSVWVLYDSGQDEVTSLVFVEGSEGWDLYACGTSAKALESRRQVRFRAAPAGRPEAALGGSRSLKDKEGVRKLEIANTKKTPSPPSPAKAALPVMPAVQGKASFVYRISRDGFVTDVFSESAVFFAIAQQKGRLFLATGNDARLYSIDPALEEHSVIYADKKASQITAVSCEGQQIYIGTSNRARLVRLGGDFAKAGTYTSDLIDAGQPARWGKFQIDGDVPAGCKVEMACRSGNVKDVNDPAFSEWTEDAEVIGPLETGCPLGRFFQYRLTLKSADGRSSPLIREVAVAHVIPNLPPRVEQVTVERIEAPDKKGIFKVAFKASDDNNDKLVYRIDFRRPGRESWIMLEEQLEADSFEWDAKAVEDGRYELRVTASDERSNTAETKLSGSRISEPVVVDNTGPGIVVKDISINGGKVTLKLKAVDELSAIGKMDYTVDSNKDWIGTMPDDLVYDTRREDFAVVIEALEAGEHIISIKVSDDIGNTTYKTFDVEIEK